jgi:hypothetical protein
MLILYHLFPSIPQYVNNFLFFFKTGYTTNFDYLVIVAGELTIDLPQAQNIRYTFTENINYDFGGYGFAINSIRENLFEYDFFFFINSSVRGPFLKDDAKFWFEKFQIELEAGNSLVGATINILESGNLINKISSLYPYFHIPYTHIQSTTYVVDKKAMEHLVAIGFYDDSLNNMTKEEVIIHYEIRLSQELLSKGFLIKSLLNKYDGVDYREEHHDINFSSRNGDPSFRGAYFGQTINPYEVVFIKTNRNILGPLELFKLSIRSLNNRLDDYDLGINIPQLRIRLLYDAIISNIIYLVKKIKLLVANTYKLSGILEKWR